MGSHESTDVVTITAVTEVKSYGTLTVGCLEVGRRGKFRPMLPRCDSVTAGMHVANRDLSHWQLRVQLLVS